MRDRVVKDFEEYQRNGGHNKKLERQFVLFLGNPYKWNTQSKEELRDYLQVVMGYSQEKGVELSKKQKEEILWRVLYQPITHSDGRIYLYSPREMAVAYHGALEASYEVWRGAINGLCREILDTIGIGSMQEVTNFESGIGQVIEKIPLSEQQKRKCSKLVDRKVNQKLKAMGM